MISWSLFFIVTINGENNFCFNTVKTLTYLTCEVCWLQCLFLQEFGVKSNTNSLPPRWRNLERKWRCRVSRQVIQWQASILAGYDRGQEMLWSGLGGWTQAATLLPSAAPSKAVHHDWRCVQEHSVPRGHEPDSRRLSCLLLCSTHSDWRQRSSWTKTSTDNKQQLGDIWVFSQTAKVL